MKHHIEVIQCPECGQEQKARVLHTIPFTTYIHECIKCNYIIMESEWNKINKELLTKTGA